MRSTFYGFEIAKSGLFSAQQNLNITGHNIANAGTPGYTRQRLNVSSIPAPSYAGLMAISDRSASGQGVRMEFVDQIRNPFLDSQFRQENTAANNWVAKENEFAMIEGIFNNEITEDASGVSAVFSDFYAALHKFAENPTTADVRKTLLQSAITLTETMTHNAKRLSDQYINVNKSIDAQVKRINTINQSIAELNKSIFSYELTGAQANDLRDKRNLLLDELSGIIPITYETSPEGYFSVQYQGKDIVNHAQYEELATAETKTHAFLPGEKVFEIYWKDDLDANGQPKLDVNGDPIPPLNETRGELGGYFQIRDGDTEAMMGIPYVMKQIDSLCKKVVYEVNKVHVNGWSIPNNGTDSKQGNRIFDDSLTLQRDAKGAIIGYWTAGQDPAVDAPTAGNPYDLSQEDFNAITNITAASFKVDEDIKKDIYLFAASDTEIPLNGTNDQKGNNKNALDLVELLTKKNSSGNPDNFDSVYKSIIVTVGIEMAHITRMADNQATVLGNIQAQKASVSNVSLDEEITNVVKFGHSYNAASRVITAIDEQLDTIINRMGVVGR